MKHFVFLEFTNPKLRSFLTDLRSIFYKKQLTSSVHITVRGPYEYPPNKDELEPLLEKLQGFGLVIGGTGIFNTKQGFIVYLKVTSPLFKEIWWKPDFKHEGINPHITLYETKSIENANKVEKFLKSERLEISTFSFTLTTYTSKQAELFEETLDAKKIKNFSSFEKWIVKPGILQRAKKVAESLS